jgi:hypothetical protein
LLPVVSVPSRLASFGSQSSQTLFSWYCVQNLFCWNRFPLARPLPSTVSASRTRTCSCSTASPVLWVCPTSCVSSSLSCSLGIHSADRSANRHDQTQDLPVPVREACVRAQGLRPRGAETHLAIAMWSVLPSELSDAVGTPEQIHFRGSIPGPHAPCQRFACHLTATDA